MLSSPLSSEEAYLAAERLAPTRSDYLAGEVLPPPASSPAQALLAHNLGTLLAQQTQGRSWAVLASPTRLYAPEGNLYTYPDAMLVRGEAAYRADAYHDNLLNPVLLAKVLPHNMPAHFKQVFELYYSIPTVQHVLLLTEDAARVSMGSRQPNGLLNVYGFTGLDAVILLPDLELELPLAELYRHVPLLA